MEERSFEETMRVAESALKEMRSFTENEWFLSRLRLVSASLENLLALYDEISEKLGQRCVPAAPRPAGPVCRGCLAPL